MCIYTDVYICRYMGKNSVRYDIGERVLHKVYTRYIGYFLSGNAQGILYGIPEGI